MYSQRTESTSNPPLPRSVIHDRLPNVGNFAIETKAFTDEYPHDPLLNRRMQSDLAPFPSPPPPQLPNSPVKIRHRLKLRQ